MEALLLEKEKEKDSREKTVILTDLKLWNRHQARVSPKIRQNIYKVLVISEKVQKEGTRHHAKGLKTGVNPCWISFGIWIWFPALISEGMDLGKYLYSRR